MAKSGSARRVVGPGYQVTKSKPSGVIGKATGTKFPWKIRLFTDESGNPYIKLLVGTLNNMIPTNMFDQFFITSTQTWYVILHAETDGYRPTTCTIRVDTVAPPPFDIDLNLAPATFELLLGVIVNLTRFQLIDALLQAYPSFAIASLVESPAPGRPYYDDNYTWGITQY